MTRIRTQGFTLIEAAVAIAVVAILSGIIVPLVVKNLQDSQNARAKNDVQVIAAAIASQLKDTGSRPTASAAGTNGTGVGQVDWHSGSSAGSPPLVGGAAITLTADNTFTNLFTPVATSAPANLLFGTTASTEFSYKGPYLANDVAAKTDPWGTSYLILGYSATNSATNGPIWVISAGADKTTVAIATGAVATTWAAGDDIVVRVN